jgi:hypothetical protein
MEANPSKRRFRQQLKRLRKQALLPEFSHRAAARLTAT